MSADKPMSFKAGTYKGMDISFGKMTGTGKIERYGGILLRAMLNLKTGEYIEGPCNLLTTLLAARGVKECKDLASKSWPEHDGDIFDPNNGLAYLKIKSDLVFH